MSAHIEPPAVVQAVNDYALRELRDRERFDNREPLDESGIFSLHMLAAEIYALGHADGEACEMNRQSGEERRVRALNRDRSTA